MLGLSVEAKVNFGSLRRGGGQRAEPIIALFQRSELIVTVVQPQKDLDKDTLEEYVMPRIMLI